MTYIANTVCEQITRENAKLPHPFETSKNRLQKEQEEEEKQKALEQQKLQEQIATTSAAVPKTEVEPQSATPLVVAPEPVKQIQPPPPPLVVMLDPVSSKYVFY